MANASKVQRIGSMRTGRLVTKHDFPALHRSARSPIAPRSFGWFLVKCILPFTQSLLYGYERLAQFHRESARRMRPNRRVQTDRANIRVSAFSNGGRCFRINTSCHGGRVAFQSSVETASLIR